MVQISVKDILPNQDQPRKYFDSSSLMELSSSIRKHGLLENLVVRKQNDNHTIPKGKYELICGERRLKACKIAGVTMVTASVKDLSDKEAFELSLTENVQRDNLSPIEEAQAYRKLQDFHSQGEISKIVDKSRTRINQMLKLLDLPKELHPFFNSFCGFKPLTERHGRELLRFKRFLDKMVKAESTFCHHCTDEYEEMFLKNLPEKHDSEVFRRFYEDYCLSGMIEKDGEKYQVGHKYIKDCLLFDIAQGTYFHNPSFNDFTDTLNWFMHDILFSTVMLNDDWRIEEARKKNEELKEYLKERRKKKTFEESSRDSLYSFYQLSHPLSYNFSGVKKEIDRVTDTIHLRLRKDIKHSLRDIRMLHLLEKYGVDKEGMDEELLDWQIRWMNKNNIFPKSDYEGVE